MSMFADWQGKIDLPATELKRWRTAGNMLYQQQFRGASVRVQVFPTEIAGHHRIQTNLAPPFDSILLRYKGARRTQNDQLVVRTKDGTEVDQISADTAFEWDSITLLDEIAGSPSGVLRNWRDKFSFREEDQENGIKGLRTPQVGALHAISAHFAIGSSHEAATVVLPTGTGKTETMLSMLVYRRLPKALVVVPSTTLRNQITGKFVSLGVLPDVQVIPDETIGPIVAKLTSGLCNFDEACALIDQANVIVALPQTLKNCTSDVLNYLVESCSDLIVDEAHHVPASQWSEVKKRFESKRVTQFTATPFRHDKKRIDGKIIFNFKLGDAQASDYYRPINLKTIEEFGDQVMRDRGIAEMAVEALRVDRQNGLDHVLMARCRTKERAEHIHKIYQELAPEFSPQLVYSGSGRTLENRAALDRITRRDDDSSQIVVCVDMLGEGFDLPNLKIAALHDCHKSLAITLQFIGRFTRKGDWKKIGEATVIANTADPETEDKLADLYSKGADWDGLIKRLSEDRIGEELRLQEVVEGLKTHGSLHKHISLWNLKPGFSAQIFRTKCHDWTPLAFTKVLPKNAEAWHALSDDGRLLVAVICRPTKVTWGNYQNLEETLYDLLVARWDAENQALFLYASDYDGLKSQTMAKELTDDKTMLLQGPVVFNILNNVELPLVKNLGSSRIGAISFTSYFGPNVTEGLARIEKAQSTLNNIACLGYEDGNRVLWGGSQKKGKVWQRSAGTISQWIEWTEQTWRKVSDEDDVDANITRDFLRPQKLEQPYGSFPISVEWGEQAQMGFSDKQFVEFGGVQVPFFLVDIDIEEVDDQGGISLRFSSDTHASAYRFLISEAAHGGYAYEHLSGPQIAFHRGNGATFDIVEYFLSDPPIIRYVDGTHSYNCYHIPTPLDAGGYPRDQLEEWDWADIPMNAESIGKLHNTNTIQHHSFLQLEREYDVVFNDDGKGEAADLVCLKDVDAETIKLCLVHCKNAVGGAVSNDIRNFYTVCGQAQKCISVKHGGIPRMYHNLKRRQNIWQQEGADRFLKSDIKQLSYFKEKSRRAKLEFEVILVQPGGSKANLSDDILALLGTTDLFLKKTTLADFRVVVSK